MTLKEQIQQTGNKRFIIIARNNAELQQQLINETSFLINNPSLSERAYCVLHDIKEQPVCKWCGEPLRFRKMDKGYFATCGKKECKGKGIAAGAAKHDFADIAQKLKALWTQKPPKPKVIKPKPPVYTRKQRCWDALMKRIEEMGYIFVGINGETITLRCPTCGTEFELLRAKVNICYRTNSFNICPKCFFKDLTYRSQFEKDVCAAVSSMYDGTVQTNRYIDGYEVDIKLPDLKVAIECNGLYWHGELYKEPDYHIQKKLAVESTGYLLVYIWEDEWHYNQEHVMDVLKKILSGETVTGSYDYCRMPRIVGEPQFGWCKKKDRLPKRMVEKPNCSAYRVYSLPAYKAV